MEDCELEFREESLRLIARKAMDRKTGARGLRTILEHILLNTMFDLPSLDNVCKVVVDEAVVRGDSPPLLIIKGKEQSRLAGDGA